MKRTGMVLVALLWATVGFSQSNYNGGGKSFSRSGTAVGGYDVDSLFRALGINSDGSLVTAEKLPIYDMNGKQDNFFTIDSLGVTVGADSSGWIDTHRYRTMWLWVYPQVSGKAGGTYRVALQVRGSTLGTTDSSGMMPWYPPLVRTSTVAVDSIGMVTAGVTAIGANTTAFTNEITIILRPNVDAGLVNGFKGIPIPLTGWWAPYTQFKFRLLNFPSQVKLACTLVGTPL